MTTAATTATFRGVPGFFHATCYESMAAGGPGYESAGFQLARHVANLVPDGSDYDEWEVHLDDLIERIESDGDVLAWFDEHYPKCMELVPKRRRVAFRAGVLRAYVDELIHD